MAKSTLRNENAVGDTANGNGEPVSAVDSASGGNDFAPGLILIDPGNIGDSGSNNGSATDTAGDTPKRRGRKPGSTYASKKGAANLDVNGVESILYSAHAMLAGIFKAQEFALDKTEAKSLAEAISNVSRHYDVAATQKSIDWTNLLMVCGMVYGTRFVAMRENRKAKRRDRQDPADSGTQIDPNAFYGRA